MKWLGAGLAGVCRRLREDARPTAIRWTSATALGRFWCCPADGRRGVGPTRRWGGESGWSAETTVYRWPDSVRDEVLPRLLVLKAARAAAGSALRRRRGPAGSALGRGASVDDGPMPGNPLTSMEINSSPSTSFRVPSTVSAPPRSASKSSPVLSRHCAQRASRALLAVPYDPGG